MINKGFTLVETLIAVLVLMVAIVGPLTIASKGIQTTNVAKDQNSAFFLAQEGVEAIRFIRDTNKLSGATNWLTGAGATFNGKDLSSCVSANGCTIEQFGVGAPIIAACGGTCPVVNYNPTLNQFTYQTGGSISASIFTRKITITSFGVGEAQIVVVVSWNDPQFHFVTVKENIYDWQ